MSSNTSMPSSTKEEALWALEQAKERDMVGPEDTALIFHSWTTHRKYLTHLKETFGEHHNNAMHAIAVKTNPHPAILAQLVDWGFGLECASMEEVYLAMNAGCPGPKIVFDSPVKTKHEIRICHENPDLHGILVNVNCLEELERIPENPNFVVGLRINPLVDTGTPEIFQVSGNESKFGTPIVDKAIIMEAIEKYPVTQLHVHSGTAMEDLKVAVGAIASVVDFGLEANEMLLSKGITDRKIVGIDIGGGLRPEILGDENSDYGADMSRMQYYVSELRKAAPALFEPGMKLVTEFGQWSYFYSGYVYSQIEYTLQREATNVAYIHLGADMFLRDIYTGQDRGIEFVPVGEAANRPPALTDIAGPLCFAGDYLQQQVTMPRFQEGDEIMMLNTGSNAFGLWSRHCSRTTPQVIGVDRHSETLTVMSPRRNPHLEESYKGVLLPWEGPPESTEDEDDAAVAAL
jgi:diaminopimelate decarboxylase